MKKEKKEYTITTHYENFDSTETFTVLAEAKRWGTYYKKMKRSFIKNF